LTHAEWTRWVKDVFRTVEVMPSAWEHELTLLAVDPHASEKQA